MVALAQTIKKNLQYVLFVLLALFPLGELTRIQFQSGVAITLNDCFVAAALICWIFSFVMIRKVSWKESSFILPLMMFLAVCLLSLFLHVFVLTQIQLFVSFLYLLRFAAYVSLYGIVQECSTAVKKKLLWVMAGTGFVFVLVGILQYLFYPNLRNLSYLGWDPHLYRLFGSFLDPNFTGVFLAGFFFFILSFLQYFITRRKRNVVIFLTFMSVLIFLSIFLTSSRSALIALFFGGITFIALTVKKLWLGVILSIGIIALLIFPRPKASEGTNMFRSTSTFARFISSKDALVVFSKEPIFGVGFDAYRYAKATYGLQSKQSQFPDHAGSGTDMSFLFVLSTTGIVGFFTYLYLWLKLLTVSYKKTIDKKDRFKYSMKTASLLTLVVFLTGSFFLNVLFYPFFVEWQWILLGITENM